MSRRIDATRLRVGQRIFCRVNHHRTVGWSATGYAMRINAGSTPGLALWNGQVVVLGPDVTVEVGVPTDGHHAPWTPDPLPELLPTAEGALVLTRSLRSHPGAYLLRLEDVGEGGPLMRWIVAGAGDWIDTEDIGDDWVEIDPATLRSKDAT